MKKLAHKIVLFNRRKKLLKDGTSDITIHIYYDNNNRKYLDTGIKIRPDQWNETNKKIKGNHPNYIVLNNHIQNIIHAIENNEMQYINNNQDYTINDIVDIDLIERKEKPISKSKSTKFLEFAYSELNANTSYSEATIEKHTTTLRYLEECFGKDFKFSDINFEFAEKFKNFLYNKPSSRNLKNKIGSNTVIGHIKKLKVYLNKGIKMKLLDVSDYPFGNNGLVIRPEPSTRVALNSAELKKLETIEVSTRNSIFAPIIKDFFLFSCYTGLRISDIKDMKAKHFYYDKDDLRYDKDDLKTGKPNKKNLSVLFNGKPERVIEKYLEGKIKNDLIFDYTIEEQSINRILKYIAIEANIQKSLSFHCSRDTFGTMLAIKTGNVFLIQKMMNHSDIQTSMRYIKDSENEIEESIKNINWE